MHRVSCLRCGHSHETLPCLLLHIKGGTSLDITTYSTLEIVGLYGQRWDVELDLRHLKTTLGMDVLQCKTPSMVRKEIYVYLLAYNLLRGVMW